MKATSIFALLLPLIGLGTVTAQDPSASKQKSFEQAASEAEKRLQASIAELNALFEQMADEKIPLSRKLNQLEGDLVETSQQYQEKTRVLDGRALDLNNLRTEIKAREEEVSYLSNLLDGYIRNFESRLHIAEVQRYAEALEAARLAPENSKLSEAEVFAAQAALLDLSLDRLQDAVGGTRFAGRAVNPEGTVEQGEFVLLGPAAIFCSADGSDVGTAEQRLGSLEAAVIAFANIEDAEAARHLIDQGEGVFPLDPTLGNAHKVEATEETLWEHIQKGGVVMVPIFAMAGAALLVAVLKYIGLLTVRRPSRMKIAQLLAAVAESNEEAARRVVRGIQGPVGHMLSAAVDNLKHPRDVIEEVMYESVLTSRLKLQRFLPFIAICAASAPLLGLLGTVTGIISTFKLITVFGSGDVKTLSGGISEALITTEFGLIVAIPSLLMHAFLSRKAKGVVDQMEKAGVALVNQVAKTPFVMPLESAESKVGNGSGGEVAIQAQPTRAPDPAPRQVLGPREELGSQSKAGAAEE